MFENEVYIGRDGWLFLAGGSNDTLKLFSDPDYVSSLEKAWLLRFHERSSRLRSLGIVYKHLWIPDKLSVYHEHIESDFPMYSNTPLGPLIAAMTAIKGEPAVDLYDAFQSGKQTCQLYWKTDTHWTYHGAFCAYAALCAAIGAKADSELEARPIHKLPLYLDLGSKLKLPVEEIWGAAQVIRNAVLTYSNPVVKFLNILQPRFHAQMHVGTSVQYDNAKSLDSRRLLLFGDSFSEYRPHLLTGLLAETFASVRFVWSSSVDYNIIDQFKPDIVITETADRFVTRAPSDEVNIDRLCQMRIALFLEQECNLTLAT